MRVAWIFCLLLVACAPKEFGAFPRSSGNALRADKSRALLFPEGVYFHDITVRDRNGKKREFKGVLKLEKDQINIVGLSPFNTTFFRITENLRTKAVSNRFYFPVPAAFKTKFVNFYDFMKKMFVLPMKRIPGEKLVRDKKGNPVSYSDAKLETEITFSQYDANRIPALMEIRQKNFSASILLKEYRIGTQ